MFNVLRSEVNACFVDIGGIVDHHCLNFLFIIQLGFLPYFSYLFTIQLTFLPYCPYCEMRWKIWKKDKFNSEKIEKIWKKGKLNGERIGKI
jgi:hypothetical protein